MGSDNARRVLLCEDEADLADHLANYLQMHARICRDGPGGHQGGDEVASLRRLLTAGRAGRNRT
jgi:hypothetical protein